MIYPLTFFFDLKLLLSISNDEVKIEIRNFLSNLSLINLILLIGPPALFNSID